jgi:MSHA biogenesis protein MshM
MIYLNYFNIGEAPFGITPHTAFFYPGSERGAILGALIYAAQYEEGIVKVSGEVGSGKSMLCRKLNESLPDNIVTVYLANPSLGRDEILAAILEDLVPDYSSDDKRGSQLIRKLQSILIDLYTQGKRVLLLVDEAHAMPVESLEEIRLLSNLESKRHKLLHIVLFGQPELDELLAQHTMRSLRERITQRFFLKPMSSKDIGHYLRFRLKSACYHGPELFSPKAIELIAVYSHGLARRVNVLADKALLAAYTLGESRIEAHHVKQAIADAGYKLQYLWPSRSKWLAMSTLLVASVCGILAMIFFYKSVKNYSPSSPILFAPPNVALAQPQPSPTETNKTEPSRAELAENETDQLASAQTVVKNDTSQLLVEDAFARGTAWLADSVAPNFSIQLSVSVYDTSRLNAFLNQLEKVMPASNHGSPQNSIMLINSHRSHNSVNILYGQYDTRQAALAAYLDLPATVRPRLLQIRTKTGVFEESNAREDPHNPR